MHEYYNSTCLFNDDYMYAFYINLLGMHENLWRGVGGVGYVSISMETRDFSFTIETKTWF